MGQSTPQALTTVNISAFSNIKPSSVTLSPIGAVPVSGTLFNYFDYLKWDLEALLKENGTIPDDDPTFMEWANSSMYP